MKFLVVEDEPRMAELLQQGLEEDGHVALCAHDGISGLETARAYEFDAILLDVMLPGIDGFELLRRLRADHIHTPVLMLTAMDAVPSVVKGLDLGADDYLTKPFSLEELLARLRTVVRRKSLSPEVKLQVNDLTLDPTTREVTRGGIVISLTRTEYALLERLMLRPGKVVARTLLIEAVWGFDREIEDNTLDAFIRLLRNKVDGPGQPKLIHTVRGVGYCLRREAQA